MGLFEYQYFQVINCTVIDNQIHNNQKFTKYIRVDLKS